MRLPIAEPCDSKDFQIIPTFACVKIFPEGWPWIRKESMSCHKIIWPTTFKLVEEALIFLSTSLGNEIRL